MLTILACADSPDIAAARRRELNLSRDAAVALGRSALEAALSGHYVSATGTRVEWSREVQAARLAKASIPPGAPLPAHEPVRFDETRVQVSTDTTLAASRRWREKTCGRRGQS
jgi:hypothetical protein